MNQNGFEIERKFLIRMPDEHWLRTNGTCTRIEQTYLQTDDPLVSERVRRRGTPGSWTYTHTVKRHITAIRRLEDESVISSAEYEHLLMRADPECRTIEKDRWVYPYKENLFEIDIFPFWSHMAYMEVELTDEAQKVEIPREIVIIKEVTGDKRYTNASLAKEIPMEE